MYSQGGSGSIIPPLRVDPLLLKASNFCHPSSVEVVDMWIRYQPALLEQWCSLDVSQFMGLV